MFYLKLAWSNLRKSTNIFAPFMLASTVLFVLTCSTFLLFGKSMRFGNVVLGLAAVVLTFLAIVMEIYSYNFLLKQRSREFGLYHILGMNKSRVGLVSTIELIIIFIGVVVFGSIFSAIFSQFFHLIFANLSHYNGLVLVLSPSAFITNSLIFAGIFLLLELIGLYKIRFSSPLVLFKNKEQGEREPRGNLVLAFLSLVAIGFGYYLSLSSSKIAALAVIYRFFIAVVLVIIGTYLLYISFMTWYLKRRRKNKNYFYKPEHFITTSQLIFRMKQNAVGLANITILAVMAFVTIATTTSLYTSTQTTVNNLFPKDSKITISDMGDTDIQTTFQNSVLDKLDKSAADFITYKTAIIPFGLTTEKNIVVDNQDILKPNVNDTGYVYLITQDDFRKLGNTLQQLKENQTAFFVQKGDSRLEKLTFLGKQYDNIKNFKSIKLPEVANTYNPAVLVVSNDTVFNDIKSSFESVSTQKWSLSWVALGHLTNKEVTKISKDGILIDKNGNHLNWLVATKSQCLEETYSYTGGFLFTGFLLGISFLLGAALIIYYKQYSEGHEDRKSYEILQEIGMTSAQIKKSINSQILMVFFMPLALAALHFLAALVMLKQMLLLFGVTSSSMIYTVSALTIAAVMIIYFIIYKLTSRTYYKIIER